MTEHDNRRDILMTERNEDWVVDLHLSDGTTRRVADSLPVYGPDDPFPTATADFTGPALLFLTAADGSSEVWECEVGSGGEAGRYEVEFKP